MNAKTDKDCAGKALYLEFRKETYTYQLVFTPDVIGVDGIPHPMSIMSRRISVWHPRRNWGFTSGRGATLARDAMGEFEPMSDEDAKNFFAPKVHNLVKSTLDQLFHKEWTLYKTPLVVEVSYKDIASIRMSKTPNDLIRRIQRSREAAGWGESLFNEVAAPVVAS